MQNPWIKLPKFEAAGQAAVEAKSVIRYNFIDTQ